MRPVDALALFYDFLDLTPIGRDGDEMIRRLTTRLVAIDLLAPAEQLLEHQVKGAWRRGARRRRNAARDDLSPGQQAQGSLATITTRARPGFPTTSTNSADFWKRAH